MKLRYSATANKAFADAPAHVQKAFLKQAKFLQQNLAHPSLRAKKYDEAQDIWQARVSKGALFSHGISQLTARAARSSTERAL
jgi:mRNA-degrading endonuclease RelE of RelBE toxin-antitoxin system